MDDVGKLLMSPSSWRCFQKYRAMGKQSDIHGRVGPPSVLLQRILNAEAISAADSSSLSAFSRQPLLP
jgi:hypothetical protein